jgi:SAM-dependent methyltransferase
VVNLGEPEWRGRAEDYKGNIRDEARRPLGKLNPERGSAGAVTPWKRGRSNDAPVWSDLMASVKDNLSHWGSEYEWPENGDEWSQRWGDPDTQWRATLLPRVSSFLGARSVLEIAPGYGRWSKYLIDASETYIGVDLAESCVARCRERFKNTSRASFYSNDGRSLPMVTDNSVDFIFSFDSLVHVEEDAIRDYIREFARILAAEGIAFIHHSNLGAYGAELWRSEALVSATQPIKHARGALRRLGLTDWHQSRAPSMSAERWVELCDAAGVVCVGQEVINWNAAQLTDCMSLVARKGSRWDRPNVVVRNPEFRAEAQSAQAISKVFTSLG